MKNVDNFDVLIVYSERTAESASNRSYIGLTPFREDTAESCYNVSYSYFLKQCAKRNISAAFATSKDIIGPGKVRSYWIYEEKSWKKVHRAAHTKIIFDKFYPKTRSQKIDYDILFSSRNVRPFNDPYMRSIFADKQKTYNLFTDLCIPTVALVDDTDESITDAVASINRLTDVLPNRNDFLDDFVLKDQFGSGGNHIYRIRQRNTKQISQIMKKNKNIRFVLQPFANFEEGFEYNGAKNYTDTRLIYYGKKIVQIYIRIAAGDEFRCNAHQGASVAYLRQNELPSSILKISKKITEGLGKMNSFYALDFIVCNSKNVYLLEGNINPGIYWEAGQVADEKMTKKLIDRMVIELTLRSGNDVGQSEENVVDQNLLPLQVL